MSARATVASLRATALAVPTEEPESDGTLEWDHTDVVVVEATGGGASGLGWAYGHRAAAAVADATLAPVVVGADVADVRGCWDRMVAAVRNVGRAGVASTAVAAVDVALWDLEARVLGTSLAELLGRRRSSVPLYGSGGFTSMGLGALREQLAGWADAGFGAVKMKVGRDPAADPERVAAARAAIGDDVELMVDANGAHGRPAALAAAQRFAASHVSWFEEPVSSDDLDGLALLRRQAPPGMAIAAGEYGHDAWYFDRMVRAGAVDVAQPDATRCGGYTGFLRAAERCDAAHVPVSAHTAPQLHAHVCTAVPRLAHVEWFHDHVRIERLLFDGVLEPGPAGTLQPDPARPGHGLVLKEADAARYAVSAS